MRNGTPGWVKYECMSAKSSAKEKKIWVYVIKEDGSWKLGKNLNSTHIGVVVEAYDGKNRNEYCYG